MDMFELAPENCSNKETWERVSFQNVQSLKIKLQNVRKDLQSSVQCLKREPITATDFQTQNNLKHFKRHGISDILPKVFHLKEI